MGGGFQYKHMYSGNAHLYLLSYYFCVKQLVLWCVEVSVLAPSRSDNMFQRMELGLMGFSHMLQSNNGGTFGLILSLSLYCMLKLRFDLVPLPFYDSDCVLAWFTNVATPDATALLVLHMHMEKQQKERMQQIVTCRIVSRARPKPGRARQQNHAGL